MARAKVGLYGNLAIPRGHCPDCGGQAFVLDGRFACCGNKAKERPLRGRGREVIRMCEPFDRRKIPDKATRERILEEQNNCCAYCERRFGSLYHVGNRTRRVSLNWDHLTPYAYQQNNSNDNFVAACQRCNAWKSSLMFQTMEEARLYLLSKWEAYLSPSAQRKARDIAYSLAESASP